MGVRYRVEVRFQIRVYHPPLALLDDARTYCVQGIVSRPPGPEAVGARQKVRLVNWLQHHQDCPLRHFVFERRNAKRSFRAVRLGDVVPSHRRRKVTTRLDPAQEVIKIGLKVLFVVASRHAVDARRPILARSAIRFAHPLAVDEVVQGCEHPFRMLPRLFGYPLLFRVRVHGTQGFLQRFPSVALCR